MSERETGSSPVGWPRLEALLEEALDLRGEERAQLLDRIERENPALRRRLQALLDADLAAGSFLSGHAAAWLGRAAEPAVDEASLQAGARVGPYRVLRQIGRGGMGIVYLAERADGEFEQRVALKLVRRGLDGDDIVRFRRERQILARLEHPSIARIYDGGVHVDGRPYFAMELVEGEPITAYCDARRLPVDERVRLLRRVCDAVQYAHGNLVVHRDLKPSNILVNDEGLKLLDFGIAKLLVDTGEPRARDATRTQTRLMTPAYAAPEQLRAEPVSTATDVYALGVILFELLTGRRPFGEIDERSSDPGRARLDEEPPRPSTIGGRQTSRESGAVLEAAARARRATTAALRRQLAGDLDAIVLKALRSEPQHRYSTAAALADDLERSLDGRPVRARPEGRRYRAGRFVKRHRGAIAAATLLLVLLIAGLGAVAWQARATAREARKAEAIKEFLTSLFRSADPVQASGGDVTLRSVLDRGAERAATELASQPEIQGELLTVLAGIYAELGMVDQADGLAGQALAVHERVHGADSAAVATNLRQRAAVAIAKGRGADAEALVQRALALHERTSGPRHPDVAEDLDVLVMALRQRGQIAEALPLAERSLAIRRDAFGVEHRSVADSMNNLAVLMREQARYAEAAALYEQVVETRRRLLGDDHPQVALTLHNFSALQHFRGAYREAAHLSGRAHANFSRLYGDDHALTLAARSTGGAIQRALGRYDEAEAAFRSVLDAWGRTLGADHPNAMITTGGLGRLLRDRGEWAASEAMLRDLDERWRARMGPAHPVGANIRRNLGVVLTDLGRYDEADVYLQDAHDLVRKTYGDSHPELAETLHEQGVLAHRRGALPDAARLLRQALEMRQRLLGERHAASGLTMAALAAVQRDAGDDAWRPTLQQALDILTAALPADHPAIISAQQELQPARS